MKENLSYGEKRKKKIYNILIVILVLVLLVCAYFIIEHYTSQSNVDNNQYQTIDDILNGKYKTVYFNNEKYEQIRGLKNYLLMGIDNDGEATPNGTNLNGGQADAIFVLSINDTDKSYSVLQINRDTMTDVQELDYFGNIYKVAKEQIALAHYYGDGTTKSCLNEVQAVSNYLYSLNFTGYAALNMEGITALNNAIGGVEVTLNEDFTAQDPTMVQGSTIRLSDEQAYIFLRSRMSVGEGTNVERMARHYQYLNSFINSFKNEFSDNASTFATKLYNAIENYSVSNLNLNDFTTLIETVHGYEFKGMYTIEGETVKGQVYVEFYPNEESLINVLKELYFVKG